MTFRGGSHAGTVVMCIRLVSPFAPSVCAAQLAQDLVQQAVELPTSEREFKAHVYHSMLKAHVAQEKVMVVERLLQVRSLLCLDPHVA